MDEHKEHVAHEHKEHVAHEHKEHVAHEHKPHHAKIKKADLWKTATAIVGILLIVSIFTNGFKFGKDTSTISEGKSITADEAADKAMDFINTNLLQPGTTAEFKGVEETSSLYIIKIDIQGREFDSYVTKDGSLLFPNSIDLNEVPEPIDQVDDAPQAPPEPDPTLTKSDKPKVELFIMSHCPFGTQAEKGIIPVAELLGDKIDFDIKYVNYAMHGEKEVREQIKQYCIKREQEDKFFDYMKCFLEDGATDRCLTEVEIDSTEDCEKEIDDEYGVTEMLADQDSWGSRYPPFLIHDAENKEYGVRGSPTLVVNGKTVSSGRNPAAYLATICGAFTEEPDECGKEVSATTMSAGFGYNEADVASTASCG